MGFEQSIIHEKSVLFLFQSYTMCRLTVLLFSDHYVDIWHGSPGQLCESHICIPYLNPKCEFHFWIPYLNPIVLLEIWLLYTGDLRAISNSPNCMLRWSYTQVIPTLSSVVLPVCLCNSSCTDLSTGLKHNQRRVLGCIKTTLSSLFCLLVALP